GPDGYKQHPIGAGPYKFVRQTPGQELEFEAFTDYWRKSPAVKTLVIKGIAEDSTRVAQLQTGEADLVNLVPGPLIDAVKSDNRLQLTATLCCSFWLEFPRWEDADSPFHDVKVRQAISLALDRQALSDAETAGLSPLEGNWISEDWPGAIKGPQLSFDPARAKQLLAEAGFPNGFDVEDFTPWPPYNSLGERIVTQLRDNLGIRFGRLNTMERGAAQAKLSEGREAFRGILMNVSGSPGDAAVRIRTFATCQGSASRTCVPEIDEKFARYEASTNPQERTQLLNEIQQYMIDNHIFVPVYRLAFVVAQGPKVANETQEIWGSIPQYIYVGPYEDLRSTE
ncbi:MAG TPA: ABC transporter substrate-binding protein, partial [Dehalococcoidia bacterium]|nr:ABC transporter substrate-binding protein [Dehalococcoidia bacterium]